MIPDDVNQPLTPQPRPRGRRNNRREPVENSTYAAFTRRIITAHGKRVAAGDIEALADLVTLSTDLDHAIAAAVVGLRDFGYSWAEIAQRLGITRQAAQQRWGVGPSSGKDS